MSTEQLSILDLPPQAETAPFLLQSPIPLAAEKEETLLAIGTHVRALPQHDKNVEFTTPFGGRVGEVVRCGLSLNRSVALVRFSTVGTPYPVALDKLKQTSELLELWNPQAEEPKPKSLWAKEWRWWPSTER